MAKNLVIVESPTKAKTIKKMLGRNYKVMASVGHIRDLPKSKLGIDIENDFEPQYINIRGKGKLINELKKEAKASQNIYLATDPDREGEAISWHLYHILGLSNEDSHRVTFNEITKDTVLEQIKNPRCIDMDLVDAQQARRELDRITGYKISPLLWKKIKSGLSAGRVQSVVLKLICDRENEIRAFVPEEYYTIEAEFEKDKNNFKAEYYGDISKDKIKKQKLSNENQAKAVLDSLKKEYKVHDINKKVKSRQAKSPFTTSTMQQEAAKNLYFSTRKTMILAQNLYEGINVGDEGSVGLITYMRTDSVRISDEAKNAARSFIEDKFGKDYLSQKVERQKKQKNVQDAHECIRPTDVRKTPSLMKQYLTGDEYRLYDLIWRRFVSSLMAAAKFETVNIDIENSGRIFKAKGSVIIFDGYLKVYGSGEKDVLLPKLEIADKLNLIKIDSIQHFTQPPARFNEASLVKVLEKYGIGRPSTYAPIISTLQSRNYVVQEEKKFHPTELGEIVNDLMCKYFKDIVDKRFTAQMEDELDKIAAGEMKWKELIRRFYGDLIVDLEKAETDISKIEIKDPVSDEICEKCGANMVIKMGKFGKFLACPNFPECSNTKPFLEKIGIKCPKCKDGDIVVKRSKKGRKFYGCSNYPECDFITSDKPIDEFCPVCGAIMTETTTKKKRLKKCSNKDCSYHVSEELDVQS